MSIKELNEKAKKGELEYCNNCDRKTNPVSAAGCEKHQTVDSPKILFVFQDPHKESCKDNNVCPWCHDDSTAKNFQKLYQLIIDESPKMRDDADGRYPVYCVNAVMHGSGDDKNKPPQAKDIKACSHILEEYIRLLKPELVVALGDVALKSLAFAFNLNFENNPRFFWTYHPAPRSFNTYKKQSEERFGQIGEFFSQLNEYKSCK